MKSALLNPYLPNRLMAMQTYGPPLPPLLCAAATAHGDDDDEYYCCLLYVVVAASIPLIRMNIFVAAVAAVPVGAYFVVGAEIRLRLKIYFECSVC